MGRKPKAVASTEATPAAETKRSPAPGPVRRGRPPKAARAATHMAMAGDGGAAPNAAAPEDAASEAALMGAGVEPSGSASTAASPIGQAAQPPAALHPAAQTKPAAQWDPAHDTVRFDWPEIERTASQAGPNQVMAKLLIAARAEGANSRWPF